MEKVSAGPKDAAFLRRNGCAGVNLRGKGGCFKEKGAIQGSGIICYVVGGEKKDSYRAWGGGGERAWNSGGGSERGRNAERGISSH